MSPNNTTTQKITGVPADKLQSKINQIKADPNYISHKTISEDNEGKFWTIEVTLRVAN